MSPRSASHTHIELLTENAQSETAIVVIQGLNGKMYTNGPSGHQAGSFIQRLRQDFPNMDIAVAAYPADLRRFSADPSLTCEEIVSELADALISFVQRYRSVAIIGHCLGGLLATLALPQFLNAQSNYVTRLSRKQSELTLFLLDAPNDLPQGELHHLHKGLLRVLRLPESAVRKNGHYWRTQVLEPNSSGSAIRAYALTSQSASWVSPLNPAANLPVDRVVEVAVSHESLVDVPTQGSFAPYDFVASRLSV